MAQLVIDTNEDKKVQQCPRALTYKSRINNDNKTSGIRSQTLSLRFKELDQTVRYSLTHSMMLSLRLAV